LSLDIFDGDSAMMAESTFYKRNQNIETKQANDPESIEGASFCD
jgi:hypothetical protein